MFPLPLILAGTALGIGLGLIAPRLATELRGRQRPTAKALIRAGIAAMHRGRVAAAEAIEAVEDLYAEVQAELAKGTAHAATSAAAPMSKRRPRRHRTKSARGRKRRAR